MQWLNLRFLSFFHSLHRSASVLFSLCVRFSNVSLTCTDMCPQFQFHLARKRFYVLVFLFFFLFWLCFVYWTTWDSWLSVVVGGVGVADTRNFVCSDDSYPLYASISVSLGRGWWGRFEGKGEFRVASSFFITNLPNRRCHILWDITQMPQNWNNNYNKICWILIAELRTILHKASVCVRVSTQQLHCFTAWTYSTCSTCTPHDKIHRQQQQSMSFQSSSAMCVCVCLWSGSRHFRTPNWSMVLVFSRHKSAVVCLDSFAWKSYG